MDRNIIDDVQNSEINDLSPSDRYSAKGVAVEEHLQIGNAELPNLTELSRCLLEKLPKPRVLQRLSKPINLNTLEMLEAELRNQAIVPQLSQSPYSLMRQVSHEATVWRWRAQRSGISTEQLRFTLNLPQYVLHRARLALDSPEGDELPSLERNAKASGFWRRISDSSVRRDEELNYLERIAAYLMGAYDEPANRYQRGLNLVLQVLAEGSQVTEPVTDAVCVTLPISKAQFVRALRK